MGVGVTLAGAGVEVRGETVAGGAAVRVGDGAIVGCDVGVEIGVAEGVALGAGLAVGDGVGAVSVESEHANAISATASNRLEFNKRLRKIINLYQEPEASSAPAPSTAGLRSLRIGPIPSRGRKIAAIIVGGKKKTA